MKRFKIHQFIFYALLALLLSSTLASCGFQLKQSANLPSSFGPVSIKGIGRFSSIYRTVRSVLRQSSIDIIDETAANHTIHIKPSRDRKVLAVNSAGKVSEYELIQRLDYRVTSSSGHTVITPVTLSRSSYYTVSGTEILGDSAEEDDVYSRLEEQLINQMLEQISASL